MTSGVKDISWQENCIVIGVDHGSVLRLNGRGDVGTFGAKRGDIMLRFLVCAVCCCRRLHVATLY